MKDGKIPDDFFKDKIDYCGLEDNIYNQLVRTMARNVDIDFAKTPIIDILTGYTRYREAEEKVEQLENIRKEAIKYVQENYNELTDFLYIDKKEIVDDLLNILNKGSEE